jgi:hypothetical protein
MECVPGTGKVCAGCNIKKVRCSFLGAKPSVEVIVSSDEEGARLRLKGAKMAGLVPKAGKVSVMVGKPTDGSAEIRDTIRQQNSLLRELLILQEQTALATCFQAEWASPMKRLILYFIEFY